MGIRCLEMHRPSAPRRKLSSRVIDWLVRIDPVEHWRPTLETWTLDRDPGLTDEEYDEAFLDAWWLHGGLFQTWVNDSGETVREVMDRAWGPQ